MIDSARYLLRQRIAALIDYPSVWAGGPSRRATQLAIKIIEAMDDDFEVSPKSSLLDDMARVEEWRTSPWNSLERT